MATKPKKGKPFSIRLSQATERYVLREAKRTKRSKSVIVEALTEEAARMRRFPGIGFRDEDFNRRPWITGTGLDVWQVIEALQQAGSAECLVETSDLTRPQVALAEAYYRHYPEEIDEAIAENNMPLDELLELLPFAIVEYVD